MTDKSKNKSQARILLGAAFLMAISAIGPGFLTQTARFTEDHGANHGFIILISLALGIIVQLNVWRVIGASGMRGQDVANKLLPGLGYVLAALICIGGLAFNIGNVGGAALGLNALSGGSIPLAFGYWICGAAAIVIFLSKSSKTVVDWVMKIMGIVMIGIVFVVMFITQPPVGEAALRTFVPNFDGTPFGGLMIAFFPIMTYLGGTVGGYITFAGAHRLLDSGISGRENLRQITISSVQGISIAAIMRVFLFLAVFGVVAVGTALVPMGAGIEANPAAVAFYHGAGDPGFRFFGVVMMIAGFTSVIGAAYTSVTFLKTLSKTVEKYDRYFVIGFIVVSTIIVSAIGLAPADLLVVVGFLNGLILPVTMGVMVFACRRKDIVGDYKHPMWLMVAGIGVALLTAYMSVTAFPGIIALFS